MILKRSIKRMLAKVYDFAIKIQPRTRSKLNIDEANTIIRSAYIPLKYKLHDSFLYGVSVELSLIVPVYNGQRYLEECILSLINQKTSYKYEIILIDDGSTDTSANVLKKYENHPLIRVYYQENKGISFTRNKGIELSRGKYIGFVDNDDYVDEQYVELLLQYAERKNADIIKCGCSEFNSDTGVVLHEYGPAEDCSVSGYLGDRIFDFDGFVWGGFFRREFWGNIRFPEGFWYEDMITSFLLYRRANQFEYVGCRLYHKREHVGNSAKVIWKSGNVKSLDQYYLLEEILRINDEFGLPIDRTLTRLIGRECGFMLGHRTRDLDNILREAVFIKAATLYRQYSLETGKQQDEFCECLEFNDYKRWRLLTRHKELIW